MAASDYVSLSTFTGFFLTSLYCLIRGIDVDGNIRGKARR